jgi:hypothetical protein
VAVFFSIGIVLVNPSLKFSSSTTFNAFLGTEIRIPGSLGTEMAALILVEQLQEKRKLEACKEAILMYMDFPFSFLRKCIGFLISLASLMCL